MDIADPDVFAGHFQKSVIQKLVPSHSTLHGKFVLLEKESIGFF